MIPTPKFKCGDFVYFKQSVARDSGFMAINGREVPRILQQDRWLIVDVAIVMFNPDSWAVQYSVRSSHDHAPARINEHELISKEEAGVMLELMAANSKESK